MKTPDPQWIGIGLLVASVVAIIFEGALAAFWAFQLSRRARAISVLTASRQAALNADIARLRATIEETRELWRPYRRLLRLLRHPLTIALMQSLMRRRAAVR